MEPLIYVSTRMILAPSTLGQFPANLGQSFSDLVPILSSLVVVIGAVFALVSLSYRVEPTVSGVLATVDGATFLIVTVQVKNAGLFSARINHGNSGIRTCKFNNDGTRTEIMGGQRPVFVEQPPEEKKDWIKRNATLTEVHSIVLNDGKHEATTTPYQIRLRIANQSPWYLIELKKMGRIILQKVPHEKREDYDLVWNTATIVLAADKDGNEISPLG